MNSPQRPPAPPGPGHPFPGRARTAGEAGPEARRGHRHRLEDATLAAYLGELHDQGRRAGRRTRPRGGRAPRSTPGGVRADGDLEQGRKVAESSPRPRGRTSRVSTLALSAGICRQSSPPSATAILAASSGAGASRAAVAGVESDAGLGGSRCGSASVPRRRNSSTATTRPGRTPPARCSTQGDPAFEQGCSRPGCVRHAAPFRSTCGTSLREARLERETSRARRRPEVGGQ